MIQSFLIDLLPDEDGEKYLVYDTVFNQRRYTTAVGNGFVAFGVVRTTPRAKGTIAALMRHERSDALVSLRMVEILNAASANVRVRAALTLATADERLFFLCHGPEIYDATFAALNVQFPKRSALQ